MGTPHTSFGFGKEKFGKPAFGAGDFGDQIDRLYKLRKMGGLTFYKDYRVTDVDLNADYGGGSKTATYSATRGASNPATYFDANGVMQVLTDSDVRRKTEGYYDETGWHAAPGEFLEGAGTNYCLRSNGLSSAGGLYTDWTYATTSVTGTVVRSQVPASISGAGASAQRVQYTGIATDTTKRLTLQTPLTAVGSFVQNDVVTLSFWCRTQTANTGTMTIQFSLQQCNAAGVYLTETVQSMSFSTGWRRISKTVTLTQATVDRVKVQWDFQGVDDGDVIDFEILYPQIEKSAFPSTFIPTTTAAVTRNAESLSYSSAGNFPAPTGNDCLSFDGASGGGDDYVSVANSATGNQFKDSTAYSIEAWVFPRSLGEGSLGRIIDKSIAKLYVSSGNVIGCQLNDGSARTTNTTTNVVLNSWNHVVFSWTSGQAPKIYIAGAEASYSATHDAAGAIADDTANPLYIGNQADTTRTFDGFIRRVRIFRNKALSAQDVTALYASGVFTQNQASPVTGCTAEYNFTDGAGAEHLTDSTANANHGALGGDAHTATNMPTWSKDQHAVTIALKYRPIMLPSEQSVDYKELFLIAYTGGVSNIKIRYGTAAANTFAVTVFSNTNATQPSYTSYSPSRYQSKMIVAALDNTAATAVIGYEDSTSRLTSTNKIFPAGVMGTGFVIQGSLLQSMLLEAVVLFNRQLSATEVATLNNLLN